MECINNIMCIPITNDKKGEITLQHNNFILIEFVY